MCGENKARESSSRRGGAQQFTVTHLARKSERVNDRCYVAAVRLIFSLCIIHTRARDFGKVVGLFSDKERQVNVNRAPLSCGLEKIMEHEFGLFNFLSKQPIIEA